MIEKLLKAYYFQKKQEHPPYIHNLLRLAELSELTMDERQKVDLATITAFNINTRYDDYKRSFQKKCTPEFTHYWIEELKKIRQWIKKQIEI
jgi:HEPN domain-containing protein